MCTVKLGIGIVFCEESESESHLILGMGIVVLLEIGIDVFRSRSKRNPFRF